MGKPDFTEFYNTLKLLVKKNCKFGIIFEYTDIQLFSVSNVRASFLPGFQIFAKISEQENNGIIESQINKKGRAFHGPAFLRYSGCQNKVPLSTAYNLLKISEFGFWIGGIASLYP